MHLAQINLARLLYPQDDPIVAEFMDNLAAVNAVAERTPVSSGASRTTAATPHPPRCWMIRRSS
jgi:hypothetical protein